MLSGMEENKKSGGGDVRAKAPSWDIEREKAKNVFFGFFPLSPTVARSARHSHPSPPEKKAASRKKSRLRRKKTTPIACRIKSCSWTGAGGAMAVMEPLPRKDSASCAGAKYCAPTFNALSDSEVRRDYMAEACAYLPYDAVVFLW